MTGVQTCALPICFPVTISCIVNPFRFPAYQKVYFDHYRNPLYELNDPSAYNVDSSFGGMYDLTAVSSTLRYRNWNKDYFTSLSPSFQGADYLTNVVDMSSVLNLEDNSTTLKGHDFLPSTSSNLTWNGNSVPSSSTIGSLSRSDNTGLVFKIANLRAAYVLDKLYRISIAAGDGY